MTTTIRIEEKTKLKLDENKIHPRETYDDLLNRLLDAVDVVEEDLEK